MKKNIMLTVFALCGILNFVGCKNGYDSIRGIKNDEDADNIILEDKTLIERAIEALAKMGFNDNERVFKALKNSLDDESAQIRINAIEALMNSEDERAVALIKKSLNDKDDEVVENAVIALYNLEDTNILNEIKPDIVISTGTSEKNFLGKLKIRFLTMKDKLKHDRWYCVDRS